MCPYYFLIIIHPILNIIRLGLGLGLGLPYFLELKFQFDVFFRRFIILILILRFHISFLLKFILFLYL